MSTSFEQYVGGYRLLKNIWSGHGCQVWEVMQRSTNTRWAMKVLNPEHGGNKEQIGYLRTEYNVAQALVHPRIIKAHDFGMDGQQAFMVMELFPAPNMKQRIREGREFAWPRAATVTEQAVEALHYFHTAGWVHRDIKPDNFLIADSGEIRLIDFALAQKQQGGLARFFGGKQKKIQGTPSYISPEAVRRGRLDARADIYSLGCVLYEWIAGKTPFSGASTNDLLTRHLRSPAPTLRAVSSNIKQPFADLVQQMMAKDPKDRPASLEEVLSVVKQGVFTVEPTT